MHLKREVDLIKEAQENSTSQNASEFIREGISKDISKRLIEKKIEKPTSETYSEHNFHIESEDWDKIYMLTILYNNGK